jgi:hypothetical protein
VPLSLRGLNRKVGATLCGADRVWAMVFDQGEGSDIVGAMVAEGRCRTGGTP